MAQTGKKLTRKLPDHMIKARLVEEVAALLHASEGVTVERNVRLPPLSDPTQIREIDVLVTGSVAGYPIRVAIECKNYSDRITVGQIGEFKDKLDDVGISVPDSVYISVTGFTKDARRRARVLGIQLFELEGLTQNRLNSEVHQAFQSTVHLLLRVEGVTFGPERIPGELMPVMFLQDHRGNIRGGIWDIIWKMWQRGEISETLGDRELTILPPRGWFWYLGDPDDSVVVNVATRVVGLVVTAAGEAHRHILHDILEQKYDRLHIRTIFHDNPGAIQVTEVADDDELQAAIQPGGIVSMVFDSERAPRIHIMNKLYWPPTERAAAVLKEQIGPALGAENPDWEVVEARLHELTFEDLEGVDISAIWGTTWSGHPSSRGEDWPVKFSPAGVEVPRSTSVPRRVNPRSKHRPR